MSIEIRQCEAQQYVTRTIREGDKVRKIHLGNLADPSIQYIFRSYRLKKQEKQIAAELVVEAIDRTCEISPLMGLLEASTKHLPTLTRFSNPKTLQGIVMPDEPPDIANLRIELEKLPVPKRVNELCRLADDGDADAQRMINRLFWQVDGLSRSLFNVVTLAKDQIRRDLAGDSYVTQKAIEEQMNETVEVLFENSCAKKTPLRRMYCEILAVAWLDALRCTLSLSRGDANASMQKKLETNADRACRRFSKLSAVFSKLK